MAINFFKFLITACVGVCIAMSALAVEPVADTAQTVRIEQMQNELSEDQIKAREKPRKEWINKAPEQRTEEPREINQKWQKHKRWEAMTAEQRAEKRKEMHEYWEKMPPDERYKMRERMKEHWQKMSPADREDQRKKMHERWDQMSSEEREQLKLDISRQKRLPY
ncbi:MAG: Protein of unknown function (DUF3106) [Candidatus Nitrotoga sp. SPKER]|nr:MAG: Protein of unknown function (DUF3106) [Candidatus Nitrotoga sp. SPKER]